MATRDWIMVGIGLGIGFFIFSTIGRSLVKSAYKLTEAEVKELERKAEQRAKEKEIKLKELK